MPDPEMQGVAATNFNDAARTPMGVLGAMRDALMGMNGDIPRDRAELLIRRGSLFANENYSSNALQGLTNEMMNNPRGYGSKMTEATGTGLSSTEIVETMALMGNLSMTRVNASAATLEAMQPGILQRASDVMGELERAGKLQVDPAQRQTMAQGLAAASMVVSMSMPQQAPPQQAPQTAPVTAPPPRVPGGV